MIIDTIHWEHLLQNAALLTYLKISNIHMRKEQIISLVILNNVPGITLLQTTAKMNCTANLFSLYAKNIITKNFDIDKPTSLVARHMFLHKNSTTFPMILFDNDIFGHNIEFINNEYKQICSFEWNGYKDAL